MTEEIMALAITLGHTEDSEELRILCEAARQELTGLLRKGISPADCGGAFPLAAAWMALAGLQSAGENNEAESFTAGAVSIKTKDGRLRAAALRLQAEQVMRPWLRDSGFIFQGVKG